MGTAPPDCGTTLKILLRRFACKHPKSNTNFETNDSTIIHWQFIVHCLRLSGQLFVGQEHSPRNPGSKKSLHQVTGPALWEPQPEPPKWSILMVVALRRQWQLVRRQGSLQTVPVVLCFGVNSVRNDFQEMILAAGSFPEVCGSVWIKT